MIAITFENSFFLRFYFIYGIDIISINIHVNVTAVHVTAVYHVK